MLRVYGMIYVLIFYGLDIYRFFLGKNFSSFNRFL